MSPPCISLRRFPPSSASWQEGRAVEHCDMPWPCTAKGSPEAAPVVAKGQEDWPAELSSLSGPCQAL